MLWRAEPRNALPCGAARRIARHRAASRCIALPCGAWRGEKTARPSGFLVPVLAGNRLVGSGRTAPPSAVLTRRKSMDNENSTNGQGDIDSRLSVLSSAFTALGDDPDYLADLVAKQAGEREAEKLRDLFQAVGQLLDAQKASRPASLLDV